MIVLISCGCSISLLAHLSSLASRRRSRTWRRLQSRPAWTLSSPRWDILNLDNDGLLDTDRQQEHLEAISKGEHDVVVASPPSAPCRDWSGPQASRSRAKATVGNCLAFFALAALRAASVACKAGHKVVAILLHPECLRKARTDDLSCIWDLREALELKARGFQQAAFYQCWLGAATPKPSRLITNVGGAAALGITGHAQFDAEGSYRGPLPAECGHRHADAAASAAYPAQMCSLFAHVLLDSALPMLAPAGGGFSGSQEIFGPPPTRGQLLPGTALQSDELYIGRGDRGAGLPRSRWANPYSVRNCGGVRSWALAAFRDYLLSSPGLLGSIGTLANRQLLCHCEPGDACHGDVIVELFKSTGHALTSQQLLAKAGPAGYLRSVTAGTTPVTHRETISDTEASGTPPASSAASAHCMSMQSPAGLALAPHRGALVEFHDGAGLCSHGRYSLGSRPAPSKLGLGLQQAMRRQLEKRGANLEPDRLRGILFKAALGRYTDSPFPPELKTAVKTAWEELLSAAGWPVDRARARRDQPTDVPLLEGVLGAFSDPDQEITQLLDIGVHLGVDQEMPRMPDIFEEKARWSVKANDGEVPQWMDNYQSAKDHPEAVREQFLQDEKAGWMRRYTLREARQKWGCRLRIAALGAIEKKPGSKEIRVLYDGTHGVLTNREVRVRDQLRFPQVGDVQSVVHQLSAQRQASFALVYDVCNAHRVIPVREEDWGLQACRLPEVHGAQDCDEVWINCVGTFGMSSAAYWWARVGGAVVRVTQQIMSGELAICHLLFADDGLAAAGFPWAPLALLGSLLCLELFGLPINWRKVKGGHHFDYVGYYVNLQKYVVGLSQSRADWLISWLDEKVAAGSMGIRELRETLGRLGFASGPMRWMRSFLGPLYAWAAACPLGAYLPIPAVLRTVMAWLAAEFAVRHVTCCRHLVPAWKGEIFRSDAKAEGDVVVIGGWSVMSGLDTKQAAWFSMRLEKHQAPWIFEQEPFRLVATLELLASLVGLMLLVPEEFGGRCSEACIGIRASTDNQGNSRLMSRYLTTRFPLSLVLMEMVSQLRKRNLQLDLKWLVRDQNQPADDLTNERFGDFAPERRIEIRWEDLPFIALPQLFEQAQGHKKLLEDVRKRKQAAGTAEAQRVRQTKPLRAREPW